MTMPHGNVKVAKAVADGSCLMINNTTFKMSLVNRLLLEKIDLPKRPELDRSFIFCEILWSILILLCSFALSMYLKEAILVVIGIIFAMPSIFKAWKCYRRWKSWNPGDQNGYLYVWLQYGQTLRFDGSLEAMQKMEVGLQTVINDPSKSENLLIDQSVSFSIS